MQKNIKDFKKNKNIDFNPTISTISTFSPLCCSIIDDGFPPRWEQKEQVTTKISKGMIHQKLGSDFQSPPHQISKKQKLYTTYPDAVNIEIQQQFSFDYEEKMKIEMKKENDDQPELQCSSKVIPINTLKQPLKSNSLAKRMESVFNDWQQLEKKIYTYQKKKEEYEQEILNLDGKISELKSEVRILDGNISEAKSEHEEFLRFYYDIIQQNSKNYPTQ